MNSLESLIEPTRHSPQLVEAVHLLQRQIDSEEHLRKKFYSEMTPEQKTEFIDTDQQTIEQYLLENGDYDLKFKGASGDLVSKVVQGFSIPVVAIFDEAENLTALRNLLGDKA